MSIFNFRHFQITQSNAALKVGTDAMLLGSLCHWDAPENLLDIGTGTGVLALMCAQRFSLKTIVALEMDDAAVIDARNNAENSPFSTPISVVHSSLQDFETGTRFDAIVSNPPYFENSYKNEDGRLTQARHTDSLSYEDLLFHIHRLLTPTGSAWIIVPSDSETRIRELAYDQQLFARTKITVNGKPEKPIRVVLELSKMASKLQESQITVRDTAGNYTEEYKVLTKEFHDREL